MDNSELPEKPNLTRQIIIESHTSIMLAISQHGVKESVLFATSTNKVLYRHHVLHRLIDSLGGWSSMVPVIKVLDIQAFSKKYIEVWENIELFPHKPHGIGYFEKLTGRCKKLISAETGKHVFSDYTSVSYDD